MASTSVWVCTSAAPSTPGSLVAGRQWFGGLLLQCGGANAQAAGPGLGDQEFGAAGVDVALAHHGATGEVRIQLRAFGFLTVERNHRDAAGPQVVEAVRR